MPEVAKSVDSRVPLGFLCAFLVFEYLRPQDLIPLLGKTRIQTVFFALFVIVVFQQVSRSKEPTAPQFRLFLGFVALAFAQVPLVATNWFYALQFAYSLALILIGCAAIAYIPRNEQDLKTFLGWLIAIHVCLAVLGIRGYSGNQFNDSGYTSTGGIGGWFLGDENDAALAMIVALPLALYLFRQATTAGARLGWGMGGLLILMTVVFTFSRGGFLGLLAIALWGILTTKKRVQVIGALALAALLLFAVAPDEYWARMRTITDTEEGTAKIRQNYWAAARRMFADSPIWGVGGDNGARLDARVLLRLPRGIPTQSMGTRFPQPLLPAAGGVRIAGGAAHWLGRHPEFPRPRTGPGPGPRRQDSGIHGAPGDVPAIQLDRVLRARGLHLGAQLSAPVLPDRAYDRPPKNGPGSRGAGASRPGGPARARGAEPGEVSRRSWFACASSAVAEAMIPRVSTAAPGTDRHARKIRA